MGCLCVWKRISQVRLLNRDRLIQSFSSSNYSKMCGQGCGECVLLTGSYGTHIYMINEIGDIDAGGIEAQGVVFALGWGDGI